ncbi:LPXTG cell wall anchor domain-containing protein [Peribacillus frigoritolerans]|uniref:LPXTG cell wall anchor domain-containing protein n=1 Tax=Peribacillus frigoritolerans TaxID=450367 RepID=UPI0024C165C9|nr:LPXTG cell wall anchor domain-containing protein [Peribacillus frigoritolerans]WHX60880.1 LPXTG cell wall anchor domain-containing protein [Peribacillus frigoritolerans]
MKFFGITLLLLIPLVVLSLGMDILLGFDLDNSIKHAFNPFLVKDPAELILFIILVVLLLFSFIYRKKKKKKKNKGKGQQ